MSYETIIFKKAEGIATITLNRPEKLNAMNPKMNGELLDVWSVIDQSNDIRAVVITGAGHGFCSGADVKERLATRVTELAEGKLPEVMGNFAEIGCLRLRNINKPIIAAVNGVAVGFGCTLPLACDIRIASEKAQFGLVFVRLGLYPEFGSTYYLPRLVGMGKAMELFCTGKIISAAEAKEIGLVNVVVPHDDLMKTAYEMASVIANGPPVSIQLIKRGLYQSLNSNLEQQLQFESFAINICRQTKDHQEGIKAFMEKRKPVFKGM